MASTKRLLKERASVARTPIPYVTFQDDDDDDDDDEKMSDTNDINQWKFIITLDPAHDSLDNPSEIGKAANSPYCNPPPPSAAAAAGSSTPGSAKKSGLLAGVTGRVTKSSKKSSNDNISAGSSIASAAAGGQQQSTSSNGSGSGQSAYFAFQLDFPPNYPFKPPTITVLGQTYHPNIKQDSGTLCDDVLTGDGWGPTLNVKKICARLRKFLCDPDPDHPLESDIAQCLVETPNEYAEKAYRHAVEYATRAKAEEAMAKGKQGKKK